ncbi:MAG: hypothetical protein ABI324_26380 [Ktedonobacteraceae bacterium]
MACLARVEISYAGGASQRLYALCLSLADIWVQRCQQCQQNLPAHSQQDGHSWAAVLQEEAGERQTP